MTLQARDFVTAYTITLKALKIGLNWDIRVE